MQPAETRAVIVTGGGTGIGRAAALAFADGGCGVLVVGRRPEPLAALEAEHPRIRAHAADVSVPDEVTGIVKAATAHWGRLDVVVNNAGAFAPGPLETVTVDAVELLVRMNVLAPTLLSQAALPYLTESRGSIVNVTSTYAQKASARTGHYAATKAALESLTRSWALELAPAGVRVNAVSPGPTETDLLASSGVPAPMREQIKAREVATIPLGRRGEPADVARWIVALADPGASWVTGQVLGVDGGLALL